VTLQDSYNDANLPHQRASQKRESFQLQGVHPLTPTRGSAPGPRWGLCPQTPVWRIGSREPSPLKIPGAASGVGGSNGAISGSIKFKMSADSHLGMTALSRVTLASAGLS